MNDRQLRELKRQGVSDEDIAGRLGRSIRSVQNKWRKIGTNSEKQQRVPFTTKEDKLVSTALLHHLLRVAHVVPAAAPPVQQAPSSVVAPDRSPLPWPQRQQS